MTMNVWQIETLKKHPVKAGDSFTFWVVNGEGGKSLVLLSRTDEMGGSYKLIGEDNKIILGATKNPERLIELCLKDIQVNLNIQLRRRRRDGSVYIFDTVPSARKPLTQTQTQILVPKNHTS